MKHALTINAEWLSWWKTKLFLSGSRHYRELGGYPRAICDVEVVFRFSAIKKRQSRKHAAVSETSNNIATM